MKRQRRRILVTALVLTVVGGGVLFGSGVGVGAGVAGAGGRWGCDLAQGPMLTLEPLRFEFVFANLGQTLSVSLLAPAPESPVSGTMGSTTRELQLERLTAAILHRRERTALSRFHIMLPNLKPPSVTLAASGSVPTAPQLAVSR